MSWSGQGFQHLLSGYQLVLWLSSKVANLAPTCRCLQLLSQLDTPDIRNQTSDIKDTRHQTQDIRHRTSDTRQYTNIVSNSSPHELQIIYMIITPGILYDSVFSTTGITGEKQSSDLGCVIQFEVDLCFILTWHWIIYGYWWTYAFIR